MDMRSKESMAICKALSQMHCGKMIVGAKQIRKALQSGRAQQVFLAENAEPAITESLLTLCQQCKIPHTWVPSMAGLGQSCGIEVGAAAAAAVEENGF